MQPCTFPTTLWGELEALRGASYVLKSPSLLSRATKGLTLDFPDSPGLGKLDFLELGQEVQALGVWGY